MNNALKYGFAFVCVMLVVGMIAGSIYGAATVLVMVLGMTQAAAMKYVLAFAAAAAVVWMTHGIGKKMIEQDKGK